MDMWHQQESSSKRQIFKILEYMEEQYDRKQIMEAPVELEQGEKMEMHTKNNACTTWKFTICAIL